MDDNQLINYQLEQIKVQLNETAETLQAISNRLGKIEHHLYNDSETDSDGIVKRVHSLSGRVKVLEDKDKVKDAKLGVWGIVGGAAVMFIWEGIKYFLGTHK